MSCTPLFAILLTGFALSLVSTFMVGCSSAPEKDEVLAEPSVVKATIHDDSTVRWNDLQYQAKPDGTLMYLVAKHGLLIENSLFHIQEEGGTTHANLLPWEMRKQTRPNGFTFGEPIKIGDTPGHYSYAIDLLEDRLLDTRIDFETAGYSAQRQTLNLPLGTYSGAAFELDGQRIEYGSFDVASSNRRVVIVPRQSFQSFRSLAGSDLGFTLRPEGELEIELLYAIDWKEHRSFWLNLYSRDGRSIHHRIALPSSSNNSSDTEGGLSQNRLLNSSFELGREEWGVIFHKYDVSSQWGIDSESASHGDHSLKVSIVPQVAPYETVWKHATIASDYFQARPLDQLTIAVDLKASQPGQQVKLQLRYVPTALVPNKGSNLIEKTFTLTEEWQRYSFDARLPLAANDAYAVAIAVPGTNESAEVWVDAVSVRPSGLSTYAAANVLEAHSDTERYRRLYVPGEAFDLVTTVRNNGLSKTAAVAQLSLRDYQGQLLFEKLQHIGQLDAGAQTSLSWDLPIQTRQGMYRVEIETGMSATALTQSHQLSLGVVRDREVAVVDPDIRFGVNITDLREFWALERIGIGWSRFTFDCGFGSLMQQKGVWNEAHAAKLDALLDYQASFGVTPLAVLGPGMPKWASRAPAGSSAARAYVHKAEFDDLYRDYLCGLLDLADGRLHAVETWNEPDIPLFYRGTVREMADFTTLAYDVVKAHSPEVDVVGLGLATPAETHNEFLHELLGYTGIEPFDAISYHPYTEGRRHPARGEFREVVEGIVDVIAEFGEVPPLWATEFGFFGLGHDAKPFIPYKNPFVAREILDEEESAAAYIQAISTSFANGVEKTFYFILLEGNLLDIWLHGWVGPGGRSIESGFIAAAAACDLFYDVKCLGQIELEPGLWQTRFSGADRDFVVLWSESGDQTYSVMSAEPLRGKDLYGNSIEFESVSGSVEIPITGSPIYLFTSNLDN